MKKNFFIYLTSFFCGMSVMAVEISATKLLAPTFGTSSIIWTIVIGLIMISLSLGNILGGRSADKYNSKNRLYAWIWIAAIWIAIIPLIGRYIITLSVIALMWVLPNQLLVGGSVFSCLVIFSLPLVILGMVSPYLVKLGVKDMDNNGKTTGEIYAVSTIGSIIGTFIPTFITVPTIGTSKTFFVFSLVLNLLCLYYFITTRTRIVRTVISTLVILGLLLAPFNYSYAFWKNNIVYEGESLYNYLQVSKDKDTTYLSTNVAFGVQSVYKEGHAISGFYYEYALMAPFFVPHTDFQKGFDTLVLGFGTGTFTKQCKYFFPNSNTDGVEIDQKIVDLSKKYFGITSQEGNIYVNDGRTFLSSKDVKDKYDLIFIDAYHDITIPFHMATKEFFGQVKQHLSKDGIILMNINMRSKTDNKLMDYLTQTVKYCVKRTYTCEIPNSTNTILFASDNDTAADAFKENIKNMDSSHPLYNISRYVEKNMVEITESTHVLTDDIAPVEVLGQKLLNDIVGESILPFKDMIKNSPNGIRDIFKLISEG